MRWYSAPSWWQRFSSQPHQLFFVAALVWSLVAMVGMLRWLSVGSGLLWLNHGWALLYALFTNAFLGFLLTVIPRYQGVSAYRTRAYTPIWVLMQVGVAVGLMGWWPGLVMVAIAMGLACRLFIGLIRQSNRDTFESGVLTLLVGVGALGSAVAAVADALGWSVDRVVLTLVWVYLLPLIFVVANKMVPSFYAVYFGEMIPSRKGWVIVVGIGGWWLMGLMEAIGYEKVQGVAALLMALFVMGMISRWKIWRKAPPILWVKPLGMIWLPVGLLLVTVETLGELNISKAGLHALLVGFATTLLIGFGTRVILGHSGQKIEADRLSVGLFIWTQVVVGMRLLASFVPLAYPKMWGVLMESAAILWLVLFMLWGVRHGRTLLRINQ